MNLEDFVRESNRIEGITRDPSLDELLAHERLLALESIAVADLEAFVSVCQPDAELRRRVGLNVRVGNHIAPPGGHDIEIKLTEILAGVQQGHAFDTHVQYENLHPFTDGNGRSGRALWLWMMGGKAPLGFLHQFYYQTLNEFRVA